MADSRLLFIEGLPGTGKTTNSYFLLNQLERGGMNARWFHEVASPHPVLFFDQAVLAPNEYRALIGRYPEIEKIAISSGKYVSVDLCEAGELPAGSGALEELKKYDTFGFDTGRYIEAALNRWERFARAAKSEDTEVYILDSALFQYQIFALQFKNAGYAALRAFVGQLTDIVRPLGPALIYLHRRRPEDAVDYLVRERGERMLGDLYERDRHQPYYISSPSGAEGGRRFLIDYGRAADRLYEDIDISKKLSIDISGNDWAEYEDRMLNFVRISRSEPIGAAAPPGRYVCRERGWEIVIEGQTMYEPNGKARRLTPRSDVEFRVDCLPVTLKFMGDGSFMTGGDQIAERWTAAGNVFTVEAAQK